MSIPHAQISINKAQVLIPEDVNTESAKLADLLDPELVRQVDAMNNTCKTIADKAKQWAIAERIMYQVTQGNKVKSDELDALNSDVNFENNKRQQTPK